VRQAVRGVSGGRVVTLAYRSRRVVIHHGDCLDVLRTLPDASVHAVVTDPPYSLGFMGKAWDAAGGVAYDVDFWRDCLRVLKPGGHLLSFGGTRTSHRLTVAIEDAGFEIRDSITWLYGSGFPKSLDVSKAIDRVAGVTREVIGQHPAPAGNHPGGSSLVMSVVGMPEAADVTAPATDDAKRWQGWGTALKPASELIIVARKPLVGTVARNVLRYGVGGLNIGATRVPGVLGGDPNRFAKTDGGSFASFNEAPPVVRSEGRWPANVVLSHAPDCESVDIRKVQAARGDEDGTETIETWECAEGCPVAELDAQSGNRPGFSGGGATPGEVENDVYGKGWKRNPTPTLYGDSGGASRFFPTFRYQAKAPTRERPTANGVSHPTVKPLALMRWLVRLVAPPGGIVLDPFTGSGATVEACILEGFACVAVEREADYLPLIVQRVRRADRAA
jgi:DNA modification methylase